MSVIAERPLNSFKIVFFVKRKLWSKYEEASDNIKCNFYKLIRMLITIPLAWHLLSESKRPMNTRQSERQTAKCKCYRRYNPKPKR
jgi:hypothetical protein